jgi:phage shock protein PspC (stress-responsive transcriptional regulator)
VRFSLEPDLERLVVVVSTMFTSGHKFLLVSYIPFYLDFIFLENAIMN